MDTLAYLGKPLLISSAGGEHTTVNLGKGNTGEEVILEKAKHTAVIVSEVQAAK